METTIVCRPAASVARVTLSEGEAVTCEVGAMIAMSNRIEVETTSRKRGGGGGGLVSGLKRMLSGESFFLNHFTAQAPDQTIFLGPGLMGDIAEHQMPGGTLIVQGSSWLASSPGIEIDATWQGLSSALFSGESIFWVRCSGEGTVLLSSFGCVYEVDVDGRYVVDTGHIVAFEDTLSFRIGKAAPSLLGSFLGGEGLVCHFEGRGRLWCQTHNPPSFGRLLGPTLRPR